MKQAYLTLLLFCSLFSAGFGQIVITEISYNPPESGSDSIEYIELYNNSDVMVNLNGWSFTAGVTHTFGDVNLPAGEYLVVSEKASAVDAIFGISSIQWTDGALSNGGEFIQLSDLDGNVIDEVDYDDGGDWPTSDQGTDGQGSSIELCDPNSDNNLGTSWRAATNSTGVMINGLEVKGTAGAMNTVSCDPVPDHTVVAEGITFTPQDLTVNVGETVRWVNNGGFHNVNGDQSVFPNNPESFFSGPVSDDAWVFDFTFNTPGVYDYQCDQHVAQGMVGTVTVEDVMVPTADIVITELNYNDPGNPDSLDFIEIYNNENGPVDLTGYYFTGVEFTFPALTLESGEYAIIAGDAEAVQKYFGITAFEYSEGLSSSGETIELYNANNELVDQVSYLDTAPWPTEPDGFGFSLTLCNPSSDNNDASNWQAATTNTGFTYMGIEIFANPGSASFCNFDIATASATNAEGVAILDGVSVTLEGVVYGINFRPGGLQFVLIDDANEGISLFSNSENFGYTVTEGDELRVRGIISQFNGLTQINPSSLEMISAGNALFNPTVVTSLGEDTESQLVQIEDVMVLDPSQWTNSSSGFNVDVGNGTVMATLRIDADTDIFGMEYPSGTFTVTGLGGQFDNSSPYTEGYQLFPRYTTDFDPYVPFVEEFPFYTIGDISAINAEGVAEFIDTTCQLIGVVYGVNLRASGLQFTIIDEFGDGIGVFNNTGDLGYTVTEGDEVSVKGSISQFNGLTQINPVSVELLSSGNTLVAPTETGVLSEDTESQLIQIDRVLRLSEPSQWQGDGSSFNVTVEDVNDPGTTYVMRIDGDVELSTMSAPEGAFRLTGIGGQFDQDSPFLEGYQILPRYAADIDPTSPTINISDDLEIKLYPNPTLDYMYVDSDIEMSSIEILDQMGRRVGLVNSPSKMAIVDMSSFIKGIYYITIHSNEGMYTEKIIRL